MGGIHTETMLSNMWMTARHIAHSLGCNLRCTRSKAKLYRDVLRLRRSQHRAFLHAQLCLSGRLSMHPSSRLGSSHCYWSGHHRRPFDPKGKRSLHVRFQHWADERTGAHAPDCRRLVAELWLAVQCSLYEMRVS